MSGQESYRNSNSGLSATEEEQARFFDQLIEGFQAATARTGEVVRDFRLAGISIRLRFAGEALPPAIIPGLVPPEPAPDNAPGCEICLWDSESTGILSVSPPRPWKDFTERGNIWGFNSSRYRSAYQWGEGSVNVMDRETRQAVYWVQSHKQLPAWVLATPLRSILHWCMELNGRQLMHAGAVGWEGRGVLLPGRGGSGKSSTSLACLLAGMDFLADDYVSVSLDPEPRLHRLYSTAKLDLRDLALYPELAHGCRTVIQPGFDKVVLFLEDRYHAQLPDSLALNLVLKPRISGVLETALGPAEPLEIERALASETLVHLPQAGIQTLQFLERVSHEIPRAAIHLGAERAGIPAAVQLALATRTPVAEPGSRRFERRAFISVICHFSEANTEALAMLAASIECQEYPRTELIVTLEGAACGMADDVAKVPGNVRFLPFKETVVNAEAWNRAIREAFAELVVLVEPGDRFEPGALDALANACERETAAAWVHGRVLSSGSGDELVGALRGALIRKSSFSECGLFQTDRFFQGREQFEWLQRAQAKGLKGRSIEAVTLRVAETQLAKPRPRLKPDLAFLKKELARRAGGL